MTDRKSSLPPEEGRESIPFLLARVSSVPIRIARFAGPLPRVVLAWQQPAARSRRVGAVALVVAAMLFLVAIFADVIASDAPLVCGAHGTVHALPNVTHVPVEDITWSISTPVPFGPRTIVNPLERPSLRHLAGTDREGRDVLARTIHGTRTYLFFALGAVLAAVALGAFFGAIAGIFGEGVDAVVSRVIESVSAFPPLVLVLGVQAAVAHPSSLTLFLAIALTRWPVIARLVRGEVIAATTRDYVLAARALGASPVRILVRHIVPNVRTPLVVAAAVNVGAVILTEAALDFLRIGSTGAASWGETMSEIRDAPGAWWLFGLPGVLLVTTIVVFNLLGEALRSVLDPRHQ